MLDRSRGPETKIAHRDLVVEVIMNQMVQCRPRGLVGLNRTIVMSN